MEDADTGVFYRPLCPLDYAALKLLHQRLFPLDYDDDFFMRAVHGTDGIVAWAAAAPLPTLTHVAVGVGDLAPQLLPPAACLQLNQQGESGDTRTRTSGAALPAEMLVGCITARAFQARYADPHDRQLLGVAGQQLDEQRLLYVLTLGVAEAYQRQGIALRLLRFALSYAAETACRAIYLHVASFNTAARAFYGRAGFQELAVLPDFYIIRTGRQPQQGHDRYDACLLGCIIQPPQPTPWDAANLALAPLTAVVNGINTCMAWGCAGQKQQDDTVAVNAAVGPAAGGARLIEVIEEGSVAVEDGSPAAPAKPQKAAPEWIKSLFKRH